MEIQKLELEAEKYAKMVHENPVMKTFREYTKQDFISGATSKFVERQKLEFAIKQLKSISLGLSDANTVTAYNLLQKIKELEQRLSDL